MRPWLIALIAAVLIAGFVLGDRGLEFSELDGLLGTQPGDDPPPAGAQRAGSAGAGE